MKQQQQKNSWFKSMLLWFDNEANVNLSKMSDQSIDWFRCLPFILMHLSCLFIIWVGFSWPALIIAIASYAIRMFAITGFYHRYFSHRSFKTSRIMQFIFAFIGGTAVQRGAIWWASHHRKHHKVSDQAEDAHSPRVRGFITSHIKWFLEKKNFFYSKLLVKDLEKFPELKILNRYDMLPPLIYAITLFFIGMVLNKLGFDCTSWQALVWGFCIATTFLYHGTFTINSLSHVFGKKVFPTKDDSRNNWLLAIITLGEGWHNNHHYWPVSMRQGFKKLEIDITYYVLKLFEKMRLIWDVKHPPKDILKGKAIRSNS